MKAIPLIAFKLILVLTLLWAGRQIGRSFFHPPQSLPGADSSPLSPTQPAGPSQASSMVVIASDLETGSPAPMAAWYIKEQPRTPVYMYLEFPSGQRNDSFDQAFIIAFAELVASGYTSPALTNLMADHGIIWTDLLILDEVALEAMIAELNDLGQGQFSINSQAELDRLHTLRDSDTAGDRQAYVDAQISLWSGLCSLALSLPERWPSDDLLASLTAHWKVIRLSETSPFPLSVFQPRPTFPVCDVAGKIHD